MKPAAFMAASTASGGGAAAVKKVTGRSTARFSSALALRMIDITIGAPDMWVTPCSAIAS